MNGTGGGLPHDEVLPEGAAAMPQRSRLRSIDLRSVTLRQESLCAGLAPTFRPLGPHHI
jgi:hypothetical protein